MNFILAVAYLGLLPVWARAVKGYLMTDTPSIFRDGRNCHLKDGTLHTASVPGFFLL